MYTYNHSLANINSLLSEASRHNIEHTLDPTIRDSKANTNWSPAPPDHTPSVVFFPHTTHETSVILKACNDRCIAVTPFSGGTSFGGALAATKGGVCISFERMKSIIAVHEDDLDVVVQPGLGWLEMNESLKERGLFFPVDPAPGAKIGGMIAMSCSGTNAYHYGTMKENVISLTCVLPSGSIINTHNRPRKSSAGYDLTHLLIGSEGTLALVTEVVLRLSPLPRNLHVGLANFSTFQEGVRVVVSLQKLGHRLEALELADGPTMQSVNVSGLAPQRTFREVPTLFFKVAGPLMHIVQEQISTMKELCQTQGASSVETTQQEDEMNIIWGAPKCMGTALLAMKKNPKDIFLHSDCAVPISNLASLVAGTQDLIAQASAAHQASWFCANVGHIGDGNVHSSIVCPQEHYEVAMSVIMEITRLALSLEGTVTGEHGIGLKLREALAEEVGDDGVTMMRSIKSALDPKGVLNPDKVFKIEKEGSAPKL